MELSHPFFAHCFDFSQAPAQTVVIENPVFYRNLIGELLSEADGMNGEFCLHIDGASVDFGKHTECITDLLRFDLASNKRLCTGAQKELVDIAVHEMQDELYGLYSNIHGLLFELIRRSGMDLEFNEANDIAGLLKMYDVRPAVPDATLGENLLLYMELCAKYLKKKLFVVFHLHTLLSAEEMQAFCRDVTLRKFSLLCIETKDITACSHERKIIVDADMCEI